MHKVYDPKSIIISWNGIHKSGFAEDTFLTIRYANPRLIEHDGADGQLGLTKVASLRGEIEITLMQMAKSNKDLAAIMAAQDLVGADIPVSNLLVRDSRGGIMAVLANAYIKEAPELVYGADQNMRTWMFGCEYLIMSDNPTSALSGLADYVGDIAEVITDLF